MNGEQITAFLQAHWEWVTLIWALCPWLAQF